MASTPATSLSLISSGLADTRLQPPKGNPDIQQFVKVVHKTTRWAANWERIEFDGSPQFGQRVSCTFPRKGELITGLNIVVTMPDIYTSQISAIRASGGTDFQSKGAFLGPTYGWTNSLGHALIQQIELEIGGAIVDTLDSRQLEILDELYETVESANAKNAMILRLANGFKSNSWLKPEQTVVYVPIPFWFSKPGVYSHALPIEALKSDIVRIHVTFRPITQLYYTDARVHTGTVGYREGVDSPGGMWNLLNGRFWRSNRAATGNVYTMNEAMVQFDRNGKMIPIKGELVPNVQMPAQLRMGDAYALVEYISLEEYEAIRIRSTELTYHVEQHFAVPLEQTLGTKDIQIPMPYTNPTKEILWVFQRPEAETFNAWFLFTRDLGPVSTVATPINPCAIPWWPDASIIPLSVNSWQIVPAFQTSYSEPMESAILLYNSYDRFQHEGGSFFRTIVPSFYYTKSAVHNRYIYAYAFGQKQMPQEYKPTGAANWDKIPRKDFYISLKKGRGGVSPPNYNVYAYYTIWNVFKVYGGRGGMLFSN